MVIRHLNAADTAALLDFYRTLSDAVTRFYEPFGPVVSEEALQGHLAEAEEGRALVYGLVGEEGVIYGHSFITGIDGGETTFGIGLNEAIIGQGWGRKLMQAVIDSADERELPRVNLTVIRENTRAVALYRQMGFVIAGQTTFRQSGDSHAMVRVSGS